MTFCTVPATQSGRNVPDALGAIPGVVLATGRGARGWSRRCDVVVVVVPDRREARGNVASTSLTGTMKCAAQRPPGSPHPPPGDHFQRTQHLTGRFLPGCIGCRAASSPTAGRPGGVIGSRCAHTTERRGSSGSGPRWQRSSGRGSSRATPPNRDLACFAGHGAPAQLRTAHPLPDPRRCPRPRARQRRRASLAQVGDYTLARPPGPSRPSRSARPARPSALNRPIRAVRWPDKAQATRRSRPGLTRAATAGPSPPATSGATGRDCARCVPRRRAA